MNANDDDPFELVIKKLSALARLDDSDRDAIRTLPFIVRAAEDGEYLVHEGQHRTSCCILLAGFACRHKTNVDGDRQIMSFHIPGDILDLQSLVFAKSDHNIQTIAKATYGVVASTDLKRLADTRCHVAEAFWRDSLIDASIFREWVLNIGRRDAKSRIVHMLCEFAVRCEQAGLGHPETLVFPMTQAQIADATGLTHVHVNRTVGALTEQGLIARRDGFLQVADWDRMRQVAGFDAGYLRIAA